MDEEVRSGSKWEYKIVADRGRMYHVSMDELNRLGREGWELIMVLPDSTRENVTNFYFRRVLQAD